MGSVTRNVSGLVLLTGASGFVGRSLLPALRAAGRPVRATTRSLERAGPEQDGVEWVRCDVGVPGDLAQAMVGVETAFFLVHDMGGGNQDYAEAERRTAMQFREAAGRAGVSRIVYLGGVAPAGEASEHLKSRLAVGEVLRAGAVPTLELRASMIIGPGSASWQIVRDLALRLPAMLLPKWTLSRTCPVALQDVITALVAGLAFPLAQSAWFDLPGPEVLTGRAIMERLAALQGRRLPSIPVPFLSVSLSSWWLKLITRADFSLARELVLGFTGDLLPRDERYWELIGQRPKWTFDAAARHAIDNEALTYDVRGLAGAAEEALVQLISPARRPPNS